MHEEVLEVRVRFERGLHRMGGGDRWEEPDAVLDGLGEAVVAVWERRLEVVQQLLRRRLGEPAPQHVEELADTLRVVEVVLGADLLRSEEPR